MSSQIPNINNNNVIDLDLGIDKKLFRFGKDDSRIVAINTADFGFVGRMSEVYPKLMELQTKVVGITDGVNFSGKDDSIISDLGTIGERLKAVDKEMRDLIDFMFDAPVSAAAAPDGSMYDLYNGAYRFDIIITAIIGQFNERYRSEFNALEAKVKKHTNKYKGK